MPSMIQKRFSIDQEQKQFLESYKQWGYSDQSSIVREALARFIKEVKTKRRKKQMARKASELLPDYSADSELITFSTLDGEDFL